MQLSSVQATCRFRYVCTPTPHSAMHAMHAFAFTPVSIRTPFAGQYIRQDDRRVRVYRFEENSTAHSWLEFIGGAFYPFSVLLCARRHYTGHFKSVITKPQNVFVMKDIMSNGYRAGGNCKFFKTAEEVSDRLNFEDNESDVSHPSMFAFIAPVEQLDLLQNEISISKRLLPWDVHNKSMKYFPGGPDMFQFYADEFGLDSVHFGEDLRASENMEYMSQGSTNNALCFAGPFRSYDPITTKAHVILSPGMGHWGPDARPGDVCFPVRTAALLTKQPSFVLGSPTNPFSFVLQARWRRGEAVSMMSAREGMMSYEQLQYIPKQRM